MATVPQITWVSDLVLGQRMIVPNGGFSNTYAWEGWLDPVAWFDHVPEPAVLTPLTTGVFPEAIVNYELCDGEDNNCRDGADEIHTELGTACSGGASRCIDAGVLVCAESGIGTACSTDGSEPQEEVCDAIDNDCDGVADNFTQFCATTCGIGQQLCTAGVWSDCDVTPEPMCDGLTTTATSRSTTTARRSRTTGCPTVRTATSAPTARGSATASTAWSAAPSPSRTSSRSATAPTTTATAPSTKNSPRSGTPAPWASAAAAPTVPRLRGGRLGPGVRRDAWLAVA